VAQTHDEAFHEIQLNGKQLVFLFMAATVVSVVIFLCGVLVGRGVRAERGTSSDIASLGTPAEPIPQPQAAEPSPPTAAGSDPTKAAPPAPADDLTYFDRLEKSKAPAEALKSAEKAKPVDAPAPPPPAPKSVAVEKKQTVAKVEPRSTPAPAAVEPKTPASTEPSGSGFAVQIAALNVRSEAEAIAKRLSAKGYAAYVLTPPSGTPAVFRVRVGKFPTRREAETVASKLQKEEQFKPWVTR